MDQLIDRGEWGLPGAFTTANELYDLSIWFEGPHLPFFPVGVRISVVRAIRSYILYEVLNDKFLFFFIIVKEKSRENGKSSVQSRAFGEECKYRKIRRCTHGRLIFFRTI